jgi:hypothetical protein
MDTFFQKIRSLQRLLVMLWVPEINIFDVLGQAAHNTQVSPPRRLSFFVLSACHEIWGRKNVHRQTHGFSFFPEEDLKKKAAFYLYVSAHHLFIKPTKANIFFGVSFKKKQLHHDQ